MLNMEKFDSSALGLQTSESLAIVSHIFTLDKSPFLIIIGGDIADYKLLAIDSMLNLCNEIWITGKLAIYFLIV